MNNKQKTLAILILLSIVLISISAASAVDYKITNADVHLDVEDNGILHVSENITYLFKSDGHGVYRVIPLKADEKMSYLTVDVDGSYYEYNIINRSGEKEVRVYLYKDKDLTDYGVSEGSTVTLKLDYYMTNVVKLFRDTGLLEYKLWGEEWDQGVEHLNAKVTFPNDEEIEYWINDDSGKTESSFSGDTLYVKGSDIPKGDYVEARVLIPLGEFDFDADYALHYNHDASDEVKKQQEDFQKKQQYFNTIGNLLNVIYGILILTPLGIYLKYGREPKVSSDAIYEHEPPTDDSPAFVNAMMSGMSKDVGKVDKKGFQATIMDLINRDKLGMEIAYTNKKRPVSLLTVKSTDGLKDFEMELIDILRRYEQNGKINFLYMQQQLSNRNEAYHFNRAFNRWVSNFKADYLPDDVLSRYFNTKGSDLIGKFKWIALVAGFTGIIGLLLTGSWVPLVLGLILIFVGVICFYLPSSIGGQYTKEGREYQQKWKRFEKYLKDFSLIKEHPPESVAIWNEYLVYATALGVADKVYKSMKMEVYDGLADGSNFSSNDLFVFYHIGGIRSLDNSFVTVNNIISADSSSSGGIGGIGGGSGGGGGGAF